MAKQLNVNLNFTADTSQAQRNLMELSKTLNSIANTTPINNLGLSKEMQEAKASAKELQQHISNAFNTKTGNLDLNKLNASLQSSGQSLGTLSANLLKAGTTGEQAFMNIQKAISTASVQINQTNGLLTEFWTTLKNTARWQISSSILHGFMGALQSAWGYAKDLDQSLNDIRIVTGYNTEKMAEFAEQANKAAKALSTTTTSYTNASLIYYQQGLSEKEVLERTNITVKMANVAGKSAAEVSDQLTAVWNNFYDGSKSLEYYADVMTALGAATASSTDEIAEGLEKFAAVAETVGLSYEYATAALATVTAETRQSADVVGTAFKTLFARLQDLELGETLDDGTTLGKYSAALNTVGINIKDTNGELKDMDQILDELGNKWTNLSKDTQVALAQTVAGTRQYTQLVALMDNWDVFQTNLGTVDASEGALTAQAEIYAESWEAATARVQATAQGIYKDLFPTEDLIELANGFAVFLEGVDGVVEGLGGIKGILLLISTIALNAFQNQIGGAIQSVISKVSSLSAVTLNLRKSWTGVVSSTAQLNSNLQQVAVAGGNVEKQAKLYETLGKNASSATRDTQDMITTAQKMITNGTLVSQSISTYTSGMSQINNLQILIEDSSRHLTAEQKEQLSLLQQQAVAANEQSAAAQASLEAVKKRQEISLNTTSAGLEDADKYEFVPGDDNREQFSFISDEVSTKTRTDDAQALLDLYNEQGLSLTKHNNHLAISVEEESKLYQLNIDSKKAYSDIYTANLRIKDIKNQITKSGKNDNETQEKQKKAYQGILASLKEQGGFTEKIIKAEIERVKATKQGEDAWDESKLTVQEIEGIIQKATSATGTMARVSGTTAAEMKTIQTHAGEVVIAEQQAAMQAENFKNKIEGVSVGLQNALQSAMDTGHIISGMASGLSTVAMGISSISNMWNTLNNEEATFVEQLSAGAMGATMGISALMTTMKGLQSVYQSIQAAQKLKAAMDMVELHNAGKLNEAEMVQSIVNMQQLQGEEREAAVKSLTNALQEKETDATVKDTVANWLNVESQAAKLWQITLIVAVVAALVAGIIALVNVESKEEKQAKRSAKAAEEMKESADEAAESLNNIKSAFDTYDTAVAKLKECKEGTEEWNAALKEVNNSVLKILQEVPELAANANLFTRDASTGMLTINENERENVLNAAEQKANITAATSVVANAIANEDAVAVEKANLKEEIWQTKHDNNGHAYNTDSSGNIYAYEGFGDIGQILTDHATELANLGQEKYLDEVRKLVEASAKDWMRSSSTFNEEVEKIVRASTKHQTQINNLAANTEAAANQMHVAFQLLADQKLGDSFGGAEKTMAAAELEKETKKLKDDLEKKMTGKNISSTSGKDNAIYKDMAERLRKATGGEYTATTGNVVKGTDKNRRLVFAKNGEKVEKTASWIAQTIAAAEALEKLTNNAQTASDRLSEMDKKMQQAGYGEAGSTLMRTFIGGKNFEGSTIGDLWSFSQDVASAYGKTSGHIGHTDVQNYLDRILGNGKNDGISNETAKKYGFDSAKQMEDAFYNQLISKQKLIESFTIDDAGSKEFNNLFNQLSEKAAIALDDAYKKMNLGPLGAKAGDTFINGINEMLASENLDPDKQVAALEKLAEIDWSANDSFEKVQAIMAMFDVDLDTAQWKEFSDTMRIAYNHVPDYTKVRTELTAIGAIINDLEFGSIIKEEDFATLTAYRKEWQRLFILQADGTRKFIGNAEDMKEIMQENIRETGKDLLEKETYARAINDKDIKVSYTDSEIEKAAGGDGKDNLFRFHEGDRSTALLKELGYSVNGDTISKGGKEISKEDASKHVMAYQRSIVAQDLINNNPEVAKALEAAGYSQDRIQEVLKAAREGNDAELKAMMEGLETLVGQDYDQLNKEYQQMLASTADSFDELRQMLINGEIESDAYSQQVMALTSEQLAVAESVEELQRVWQEALATGADMLNYEIYAENLVRLGEQYSICSNEIKDFQLALQSGNRSAIESAESNLAVAITLGEASQQYGLSAEELSLQTKTIANEYDLSTKAAARLAIENQRMNKGVTTLGQNWKTWSSELRKGNKLSQDWAKAAVATTQAIADLVGASADLELPDSFFDSEKNMRLLDKAAQGSTKAINELGLAVAYAQIEMLKFQQGMQDKDEKIIDEGSFNLWKQTILNGIAEVQNSFDSLKIGTDIYDKLGGDNWVSALNEMAYATQMSVEEMNSLLNSMGVDAEVITDYATVNTKVPQYKTFTSDPVAVEGGVEQFSYTTVEDYVDVEGKVPVAQINTGEATGQKPKISYIGNGSVSNSAKNSSKSESSKTSDARQKKSDVVTRYKEIDDTIDDTTNTMNKASKAADRLYGSARLKQMQKINSALKDEIKYLKEKKEEAENYLALDQSELIDAASVLDLNFTFDDDGNISNYETEMTKLYNAREALLDSFGKTIDEDEQEKLDAFDKKIEALQTAITQYDETRELNEDLENEIDDAINQWQDNNYEQLVYKLELKIEINDRELEKLEYYLSKTEDDFYKRAEGVGYLAKQYTYYNSQLNINQNQLDKLNQSLANNDISQANYIEGLKEIFSNSKDIATSLQELDEQMISYYEDTLSMASDELSKYTDRIEHLSSVLDHYKNIMDIIGESSNYEAMGILLEGQAQTAKNALDAAEAAFAFYSSEAIAKKQKLDEALAQGNTAAAKMLEAEWEAAEEKAREAQENMLTATEEWAEAMKATIENELAGFARDLEKALTGGTSFDAITTSMERAASLQEEYLTTTNQIYETNKMINTAQREIDKTTNTVAKQRLRNFQQETEQLQKQGKLSQFELNIQQAKYELLLAEIALEEAQQAKSTVRLQRDSEGNFGYVYTADANRIADAEQKLADAQNNLYNIGLEGANNYAEQYQQVQSEMYDTLKELSEAFFAGEFESQEEYNAEVLKTREYYFGKLQNLSSLYSIAIQTDSNVVKDAWSSDFGEMIKSTGVWATKVDEYIQNTSGSFNKWDEVVQNLKENTLGTNLEEFKTKVSNITDASDALVESITKDGGVVDSLMDEMDAVSDITNQYAQWRDTLLETIEAAEDLMDTTDGLLDQYSTIGGDNENSNSDTSSSQYNNTNSSIENTPFSLSSGNIIKGNSVTVKENATNFSAKSGNVKMSEFVPGGIYTVMGVSGSEVLIGRYGITTGWVYKKDLVGFDTGGYTGNWGQDGKLAMLHEKELILNAEDTANFLTALNVLRDIIDIIDLQALNAQLGGSISSPTYTNTNNTHELQQSVTIEASFPGVTDHNEIEEALQNLINHASQFANRKNF